MKVIAMALAALLLGLMSYENLRAEDPNPNPPNPAPPTPAAQPGQPGQPGQSGHGQGGQAGSRGRGTWGGGGGGGGGPGGTFGFGGFGGGGGGSGIVGNLAKMMGVDIPDTKTAASRAETLPLGADKRLVLNVPVGGVDNPGMVGAGWKMESVFKMTDEQTKAVEALREEYKTEQKKLDDEILAQQKALGSKVTDLRQKYEKRANDVLTGADKDSKEKMDKLLHDAAVKTQADVADILPLYDMNDPQQGMALIRAVSEKKAKTTQDTETKLLDLIPADNKEKIEQAIKDQSSVRERTMGWMTRGTGAPGGPPGGGRRGGQQDQPAKPPQTPPGNF